MLLSLKNFLSGSTDPSLVLPVGRLVSTKESRFSNFSGFSGDLDLSMAGQRFNWPVWSGF